MRPHPASRSWPLVGPLVAAVLLGVAVDARADDGPEDVPSPEAEEDTVMRYPPSSVRLGIISGGVVVFGISYGLSAMSASVWPDVPGSKWLYAPIIGPWAALGTNGCTPPDTSCTAIFWVRNVLYVLDGIAQAGGAALIGEGVFMTTEADAPKESGDLRFTVVPTLSPANTGLSVVGTF